MDAGRHGSDGASGWRHEVVVQVGPQVGDPFVDRTHFVRVRVAARAKWPGHLRRCVLLPRRRTALLPLACVQTLQLSHRAALRKLERIRVEAVERLHLLRTLGRILECVDQVLLGQLPRGLSLSWRSAFDPKRRSTARVLFRNASQLFNLRSQSLLHVRRCVLVCLAELDVGVAVKSKCYSQTCVHFIVIRSFFLFLGPQWRRSNLVDIAHSV